MTLEERILTRIRTDLAAGLPAAAVIEKIDHMLARPDTPKNLYRRSGRPLALPPANLNPVVSFTLAEIHNRDINAKGVCRKVGITPATLAYWRRGGTPNLANLEATLNVLGYTLVPAKLNVL